MKLINTLNIFNKNKRYVAAPSTFSKSLDDAAYSKIPFALKKGMGPYVYDYDRNKYIDTIMSLGAVIVGHSNKKINSEVIKQIKRGSTLSLTTKLEGDLAELLVDCIPSAELVRFGKHGNDATTVAIRLARHYTGKNHILFCGYHGWQDWYVSKTSMNTGIPKEISKYSHRFIYNSRESLDNLIDEFQNKIACIIMEPISKEKPKAGFLKYVRDISKKNNILLVFDEIVTGFRCDIGGYQKKSKIIPDLSCFSKAMGNGYPISALVGKKEIMKKSNEIFYSLTFGSEPISMAAAIATIKFIKKNNVLKKIDNNGSFFIKKLNELIERYNLNGYINIVGFSYKNILAIKGNDNISVDLVKNYLIQLLNSNKVLNLGYNIFSFSHDKNIIKKLLYRYEKSFFELSKSIEKDNIRTKIAFDRSFKSAREI